MTSSPRIVVYANLQLVLVTLFAASSWMFSHQALAYFSPLWFMGMRFCLAALLLASFALPRFAQLSAQDWRDSWQVGAWFAGGMILWVMGLFNTAHVGEGAFITSLGVVLVPVVGWLFFKEKPSLIVWIAATVALIGLACLMLAHGWSVQPSQLYFVAAAVLFAIYFYNNGRVVSRVPALLLTSITLAAVGLLGFALAVVFERPPTQWSSQGVFWLLASVLMGTCARFWLQTRAQQHVSPSHAALLMTLEPLWTALLGVLFLAEIMLPLQIFGCALIFIAVLIGRSPLLYQSFKKT